MSEKIKKPIIPMETQDSMWGYFFISPWLLGFLAFVAFPIVFSLFISFCEWKVGTSPKLIGFANYADIFGKGREDFLISLYNTFYYTIFSVPLGIIGSISVALMMNREWKSVKVLRTIFYLPSVIAGVASAAIWMLLFNPEFGMINYALRLIGIEGPRWLLDPLWTKPALIVMSIWGVGSSMVLYLAGLQGIPRQLYEAAEIDGASPWQKFWNVTIPMLTPVIFFNLITNIVWSFQIFTQVYVFASGAANLGAPSKSTLVLVAYIYREAFHNNNMGLGSALAWVLFAIVLIISLLQFYGSKKWVYYEGELRK